MLLHLIPKIYNPYGDIEVRLLNLTIPELDIAFKEGDELKVMKPYPNKCFSVACRKKGKKAMEGFIIETQSPFDEFTVNTTWRVKVKNKEVQRTVFHEVRYIIDDCEYDLISDDHTLYMAPIHQQPRMDVLHNEVHARGDIPIHDIYEIENEPSGFLMERRETIHIHTIEKERLDFAGQHNSRIPRLDDRFIL